MTSADDLEHVAYAAVRLLAGDDPAATLRENLALAAHLARGRGVTAESLAVYLAGAGLAAAEHRAATALAPLAWEATPTPITRAALALAAEYGPAFLDLPPRQAGRLARERLDQLLTATA